MNDPSIKFHRYLPCYVILGIWLCINKMIFQGSFMDARLVLHKIRLAYREGWKAPNFKETRTLQEPIIDFSKA